MKNYSRQREAILKVLRSTKTHPTADKIYAETRKLIPNISLGTVYRNLAQLEQAGEILCIDIGDGKEHYDGDNSLHMHLTCKGCGTIVDAFLETDPFTLLKNNHGFKPETAVYIVYGYCESCKNNTNLLEE
ncbi:MAG: Fur family transcriptional regulator [Acutalibacteraceae bacterium]